MKAGKTWIPLLLVGLLVIQSFAAPSGSRRPYRQIFDDDDEEEILEDFTLWTSDSLITYADSILASSRDSIKDEFSLVPVSDSSVQLAVDSVFRAIFVRDSLIKDSIAFKRWFDALPKREQKKWYIENVRIPAQMHKADSLQAIRDSVQAIKDSILETTPRILETKFLPDSLYYKRILMMSQDTRFGDIKINKPDYASKIKAYMERKGVIEGGNQ